MNRPKLLSRDRWQLMHFTWTNAFNPISRDSTISFPFPEKVQGYI